jgi:hypothetical protein
MNISYYQKNLSYKFIKEFKHELYLDILKDREIITSRQAKDLLKVTRNELLDI